MRYHTTSRLSENMEMTPEGYLLCVGVPIARTGVMEYLLEEVPEDIAENASGPTVLVRRAAEDVFSPATMASYEGKDVTVDHPDGFVTPENWKELTVGHAQNVRQGAGEESDLLLADLLIKDPEAIESIKSGELREVSCGYDAEYEETAPGIGRQSNIIGNHIALVPHGRCGPRCAIKDAAGLCPERTWGDTGGKAPHNQQIKEPTMAKKPSWWDRVMGNPKVKKAMDEAAAEEKARDQDTPPAEKKEGEQATDNDDAIAQLTAKVDELTLMVRGLLEGGAAKAGDEDPAADEDPEKTGDEDPAADEDAKDEDLAADEEPEGEKKNTGDRAARKRAADADTVRRANLLAPALRARVGDSGCAVKRGALRGAMRDASVKRTVDAILRGKSLDSADCATLDAAFIAASEVAAGRNNKRTADTLTRASTRDFGKAVTPADINRMNREYHDKAKAGK